MEISKKFIKAEDGRMVASSIWCIEVDSSSEADLFALLQRVKNQLGMVRAATGGTKRQRNRQRMEACAAIFSTDISDIYAGQPLDSSPVYYVYAHCEPSRIAVGKDGLTTWLASMGFENMPFYIGKGTGGRAHDLNRNETHRKVRQKLKSAGSDVRVAIIKDGLTELEALCMEAKLVDMLGVLGKGGRLVNVDEGVGWRERQARYQKELAELSGYHRSQMK